jgi:hypothetical protein
MYTSLFSSCSPLYERWQNWKEQSESMSLFYAKYLPNQAKIRLLFRKSIKNFCILRGPMPSHGVTFITLLMTPSQRIEKRDYGRQQNNMLTNSMNTIPIDIPPPLRQYLKQ